MDVKVDEKVLQENCHNFFFYVKTLIILYSSLVFEAFTCERYQNILILSSQKCFEGN